MPTSPTSRPILLRRRDDKANPLGVKGVGELGICGAGAAVANAVYNACGVRIRDYPITPDKLILDPGFPGIGQGDGIPSRHRPSGWAGWHRCRPA